MHKEYTPYEIINWNVREARRELARKHDVKSQDSWYVNYSGLCFEGTNIFLSRIKGHCERLGVPLKTTSIHGEQSHSPRIPSKYWPWQHQWCSVELMGKKYYVDCTCGQFSNIYDDIPDYYIDIKKPKWFLPDRKNPAFNGITKFLNQHIVFSKQIVDSNGDKRNVHDGLIEMIQYDIWGSISDFIRKVLGKKDKNEK